MEELENDLEEEENEEEETAGRGDNQSTGAESPSPAARQSMEAVCQFLEHKRIPHNQLMSLGGSPAHHYTDLEGLRGIVEKDDLWLTNARYSNDEEEMEHGREIARKAVISENENQSTPEGRLYIDHLEKLLSTSVSECYICCFCQKSDLLSQWRAYAAYGTGVDLEIDIMGFSDLITKCPYGRLYYWKVFYNDSEKKERVKETIEYFRPAGGESVAEAEERARQAAAAIEFFIPTFKHERFGEEDEWRLIFAPSIRPALDEQGPKVQFRVSRNLLVPYYRLRDLIPASPGLIAGRIVKARVGPCRNKKLVAESVRMLLSQHGHRPMVDVSDTPYRG
jgi:hypothetical protein